MKVKLRALDHRNNTVSTRWGDVTFDGDGLAELDVPEDEVVMLSQMRPYSWLASDHVPAVVLEAPAEPVAASEKAFDTSDAAAETHDASESETPPQGTDKQSGKRSSRK